jgi:hypothetical protein
MAAKDGAKTKGRQLLHLVFGGELESLDKIEFSDLKRLDIVGIYPNYAQAYDAHMRYFIVHLHRLLDPGESPGGEAP